MGQEANAKEKNKCGYPISRAVCLVAVVLLVALPLVAPAQFEYLFSTNEDCVINLLQPADENLVAYVPFTFYLSPLLPPGSLPAEVNVDAVSLLDGGTVVISLSEDAVLGGNPYADEDLIGWDGITFSMWWDGSAAGLPPEVNHNAVHIISALPVTFLFSLEEDAVLPGAGLVADEDMLMFSGATFSIVLDGSVEGIPAEAGVDAISLASDAPPLVFLLSLDCAAVIAGTVYDDGDILNYYEPTSAFSLFMDASAQGIPEEVDVDAVAFLPPEGPTGARNWMLYWR